MARNPFNPKLGFLWDFLKTSLRNPFEFEIRFFMAFLKKIAKESL